MLSGDIFKIAIGETITFDSFYTSEKYNSAFFSTDQFAEQWNVGTLNYSSIQRTYNRGGISVDDIDDLKPKEHITTSFTGISEGYTWVRFDAMVIDNIVLSSPIYINIYVYKKSEAISVDLSAKYKDEDVLISDDFIGVKVGEVTSVPCLLKNNILNDSGVDDIEIQYTVLSNSTAKADITWGDWFTQDNGLKGRNLSIKPVNTGELYIVFEAKSKSSGKNIGKDRTIHLIYQNDELFYKDGTKVYWDCIEIPDFGIKYKVNESDNYIIYGESSIVKTHIYKISSANYSYINDYFDLLEKEGYDFLGSTGRLENKFTNVYRQDDVQVMITIYEYSSYAEMQIQILEPVK